MRATIRDARSQYARYECDHCGKPVGYYGIIREGTRDDGLTVPLVACCLECYEKRGKP